MSTSNFPKEMIFDRELSCEQLKLLRSQYQRFLRLSKEELDDNQYQLFLNNNKDVYLPNGTLLWGTLYSSDKLIEIKKKGILALEFIGKKSRSKNFYCELFYKITKDTLLSSFDKNFILEDNMPFNTKNDSIAFIINPTSKIGGLVYYDLLDKKFDSNIEVKNIIDVSLNENNIWKMSSILVGIPSNCISGIVLGDNIILDEKLVKEIKNLFPKAFIVTRSGNIIRDRSNMIKIEDYEKISFEYCREKIRREEAAEENNTSKKEVSSLLSAIISNTTPFEQAKILLDIGHYNIPSNLLNKLTKEEKDSLNLKMGKREKK